MGPCHSVQTKKSTTSPKPIEINQSTVVVEKNEGPIVNNTAANNKKNSDDDDNLLEIGVINYEEWLRKREAIKERQKSSKPDEEKDGPKENEEKAEEKGLFKRITDVEVNQNSKQEDPNYILENNQKLTVTNKSQVTTFLKDIEGLKGKIISASFQLRFFLLLFYAKYELK